MTMEFNKINSAIRPSIERELLRLGKEYPPLLGWKFNVRVVNEFRDPEGGEHSMANMGYAATLGNMITKQANIYVSAPLFGPDANLEKLRARMQVDRESNFHGEMSIDPAYIFCHEWSHAINGMFKLAFGDAPRNHPMKVKMQAIADLHQKFSVSELLMTLLQIKEEPFDLRTSPFVSGYSSESIDEAIAEAFAANWWGSPAQKAKPIVGMVLDFYKTGYEILRKGGQ